MPRGNPMPTLRFGPFDLPPAKALEYIALADASGVPRRQWVVEMLDAGIAAKKQKEKGEGGK